MAILIVLLVHQELVIVVHVLVSKLHLLTTWAALNISNVLVDYEISCLVISICMFDCFAASMLELARVTAESGWIPPRPIIFLFNGAEELFMLV